jgi:HAD superfamily hydrolase (TIGR01450 family)
MISIPNIIFLKQFGFDCAHLPPVLFSLQAYNLHIFTMTTTMSTTTTATKPIKAILIDLSGTLHVGNQPVPGAQDALNRLRQSGRRIRFLTNTSTKSTAQLLDQLNHRPNLQFQIRQEDLMTSVLATAAYVQKHKLKPLCLMEDLSDMPIEVQELQQQQQQHQSSNSPPQSLPVDGDTDQTMASSIMLFDSVVVGLAPSHFHYSQLTTAFRILLQHPQSLIAIHRANYVRDANDGELSLGPGAFVTALETASNCASAKVMGKPSPEFFASAMWDDLSPEEMCMIGDDVMADIYGAGNVGIGTMILVQTGKYRPGDEDKMVIQDNNNNNNNKKEPQEGRSTSNFVVCPSIVEAVEYIITLSSTS